METMEYFRLWTVVLLFSVVGLSSEQSCVDMSPRDCSDPKALSFICHDSSAAPYCKKSCGLCSSQTTTSASLEVHITNQINGSALHLQCQPSHGATIIWTLNNGALPKKARLSNNNQSLVIPNVDFSDRGNYSCIVSDGRNVEDSFFYVMSDDPNKPSVSGVYSDWAQWSHCSGAKSCGTGIRIRSRSCRNPGATYSCKWLHVEMKSCTISACPVNGGFSNWSGWGKCSQTCGGGVTSRRRSCTHPPPSNGGQKCTGSTTETQTCASTPCPVNGGFSNWSKWSTCTSTCGGGSISRSRSCTNPPPSNGGMKCTGSRTETRTCASTPCPVNGGFSNWGAWGKCSQTCGGGVTSRHRSCTHPPPSNGGLKCTGRSTETRTCASTPCPVNGGFSNWGEWGKCSQTCGGGVTSRHRSCTHPPPSNGGLKCTGRSTETRTCASTPCPVNGGFSNWGEWVKCSQTCGGGVTSRHRSCTHPPPSNGGLKCTGRSTETRTCASTPCPVNGGFSKWGNWSPCSKSCGGGMQTSYRSCTNPPPSNGGQNCTGSTTKRQTCATQPCPVNGGFSTWSRWSSCSSSCDKGIKTRTRSCTNPRPSHGGHWCNGNSTDVLVCNQKPCPDDGCNNRCGYGYRCRCSNFFLLHYCNCERTLPHGRCADTDPPQMCHFKQAIGLCNQRCGKVHCARTCGAC